MLPDQSHEILPGNDTNMRKVRMMRTLWFLVLIAIGLFLIIVATVPWGEADGTRMVLNKD